MIEKLALGILFTFLPYQNNVRLNRNAAPTAHAHCICGDVEHEVGDHTTHTFLPILLTQEKTSHMMKTEKPISI